MERQTIIRTLETCRTTLDSSVQQGQYNLAIGCAQLLVAIAEISTLIVAKEDQDDPMDGGAYEDSDPILHDSRPLLHHVVNQLSQIPLNSLYNPDQPSCRKVFFGGAREETSDNLPNDFRIDQKAALYQIKAAVAIERPKWEGRLHWRV